MISNEKNKLLFLPRLFTAQKVAFSVAVLVIFHLVGFWGLALSGNQVYFQQLTPLNLLLTVFLLFLNCRAYDKALLLFAFFTFAVSFLAEVIGVHTGLLFGNYQYGAALGFKLWQVPLLIGVNWVMLVYCSGIAARNLLKNPFSAALLGALLMVLLDFLIEPVAIIYDFWTWQTAEIPLWNYVCWLVLALVLQVYFQFSGVLKNNALAWPVLVIQAVFFFALNLFL